MWGHERQELRASTLDDSFRIGAPVGVGGTGIVFEAFAIDTGDTVVVKTLRPMHAMHQDMCRRLRREREVARRAFHSGIAPVLAEGTLSDGSPYLVMPYVNGETLSSYVHRVGLLSSSEAAAIACRVAQILDVVHREGYVHRDLKPEHVLLGRNPVGELDVYLIDFGVCASAWCSKEEREQERGRVYGTPSYCAPEQASGNPNVDGRTDLYGLGVTLFEALTGTLPHRASNVSDLLRSIIRDRAPRVSHRVREVDPQMDALIACLLEKAPEDRLPSSRSLIKALAPWATERLATERLIASRLEIGRMVSMQEETARRVAAA